MVTPDIQIQSLLDWEKPNYERIWQWQAECVDAIAAGERPETILFCEHETVITRGRRSRLENILDDSSFPLFDIERGGDATLHGPGQLVIYPILKLHGKHLPGGLHEYLRLCEEVIIRVLSREFNLNAGRFGPTGVWVKVGDSDFKVASIGIAVRRWVTYHGISINVSNNLSHFNSIRPCNFESSVMTSLDVLGCQIGLQKLEEILSREFLNQLALAAVGEKSRAGGTVSLSAAANF